MSLEQIVCLCNGVTYAQVREAMAQGARSVEDIQAATGAGDVCGGCIERIEKILGDVCTCRNVSTEEVVKAKWRYYCRKSRCNYRGRNSMWKM